MRHSPGFVSAKLGLSARVDLATLVARRAG